MRVHRPVTASAGFADRVAAAVAAEPGAARSLPRTAPAELAKWVRPAAGLAIAAGVATVAVIAFQPATVDAPPQLAAQTAGQDGAGLQPAPSYTVPTNAGTGSAFIPAARLTNYVVAHSEFSSPLNRRTVLSGVLSDDELEEATQDGDIEVRVTGTGETQPR